MFRLIKKFVIEIKLHKIAEPVCITLKNFYFFYFSHKSFMHNP